jgi:dolichol-phosphate mannosyltransferase
LKFQTILEYAEQVLDITTFSLLKRHGKAWEEWEKVLKFGVVGITGIFVNMGLLYYLKEYQGFPLLFASFIAIELSIINNFLWNEYWTFKNSSHSFFSNLVKFNLVSVGGLIINMIILYLLTGIGVYYLIANFLGILAGFAWNFVVNRRITWKNV